MTKRKTKEKTRVLLKSSKEIETCTRNNLKDQKPATKKLWNKFLERKSWSKKSRMSYSGRKRKLKSLTNKLLFLKKKETLTLSRLLQLKPSISTQEMKSNWEITLLQNSKSKIYKLRLSLKSNNLYMKLYVQTETWFLKNLLKFKSKRKNTIIATKE